MISLREWWRKATNVVRMEIALGEPRYGSDEDAWRDRLLLDVIGEPPVDSRLAIAEHERDEANAALNALYEVAAAYMHEVRRYGSDEDKADTGKALYSALFYAQPPQNAAARAKLIALGEQAKLRKKKATT